MSGPRKKAPKTIAVIDPDRCFGAFACSICQAACPVAGCIVEFACEQAPAQRLDPRSPGQRGAPGVRDVAGTPQRAGDLAGHRGHGVGIVAEIGGQQHRFDHAARIGDALPGDVERRAVIH